MTRSALLFLALVACGSTRATTVVGTWEGDSTCQVAGSRCKNEHNVYVVRAADDGGMPLSLDGYKVVNGERLYMGTLDCRHHEAARALHGVNVAGTWDFTIDGATMTGTLTVPEGRVYRRIVMRKKD
jgi:hypothetical protein